MTLKMQTNLRKFVSNSSKKFRNTRDATITLDRTRHQARPSYVVISRLVIEPMNSAARLAITLCVVSALIDGVRGESPECFVNK